MYGPPTALSPESRGIVSTARRHAPKPVGADPRPGRSLPASPRVHLFEAAPLLRQRFRRPSSPSSRDPVRAARRCLVIGHNPGPCTTKPPRLMIASGDVEAARRRSTGQWGPTAAAGSGSPICPARTGAEPCTPRVAARTVFRYPTLRLAASPTLFLMRARPEISIATPWPGVSWSVLPSLSVVRLADRGQ